MLGVGAIRSMGVFGSNGVYDSQNGAYGLSIVYR